VIRSEWVKINRRKDEESNIKWSPFWWESKLPESYGSV